MVLTHRVSNTVPTCDNFYLSAQFSFPLMVTGLEVSTIFIRPIPDGGRHHPSQPVTYLVEDILL